MAGISVPVSRRARKPADPARFWAKVHKTDGCWEWQGSRYKTGYGRISYRGRKGYAHRIAYELTYGPIPAGLYICHHCDNPPCCNPAHLFAGTPKDNTADRDRKGRNGAYRNRRSSLTVADAVEIRHLYANGATNRSLATKFGVKYDLIYRITAYLSYRAMC